ncbi:hypothetical protein EK904_002971 [Melospiza melodia maxima]|nr:hypothetical protein EK904_002971 [Melospiza melodia maxima]
MPCEQRERRANLEKIETLAYYHDQQNSLKENVQNYSRKKSDDKSVKETAWNQNHVFVFEESEEEDTGKKKNYLNEQSLKARGANLFSASVSREAPKSSHTQSVGMKPSSALARKEANNLQEKDSNFCAIEDENKTHAAVSQGPSQHALRREHVGSSTRCDAWSQTEGSVTAGKVDAGTQCGALRVCSCGGSLPAARSPGTVPAARSPGTARERQWPAREGRQPAGSGSAGTGAFSAESEYLSVAGSRTLEVLDYIDKMKEREKQ